MMDGAGGIDRVEKIKRKKKEGKALGAKSRGKRGAEIAPKKIKFFFVVGLWNTLTASQKAHSFLFSNLHW